MVVSERGLILMATTIDNERQAPVPPPPQQRPTWIIVLAVIALVAGAIGLGYWVNQELTSDNDVQSGAAVGEDGAVEGSGTVITQKRDVSGFDEVVFASEGMVVITVGGEESLRIEAEDNLMPYLESTVQGGRLEIRTESGVDIDPTTEIIFAIAADDLTAIDLSGAGTIAVGDVETTVFEVTLRGAGDITAAALTAELLEVEILGAGEVTVTGVADSQSVSIAGAGSYHGDELESSLADVAIPGSGDATVWVADELEVEINGIGTVAYYGDPEVTSSGGGEGEIVDRGAK
jgi:hypothetical protein